MIRLITGMALILASCGCVMSPTSPTLILPRSIVCAGQSNAVQVCKALSAQISTRGYAKGGVSIACFSLSGDCWASFSRNLATQMLTTSDPDFTLPAPAASIPQALLWYQGESDGPVCPGLADADGGQGPKDATIFASCSSIAYANYMVAFRNVIAQVRNLVGNPSLRIIAVELGPYYRMTAVKQAIQDVISHDGNGRYIRTNDLHFDEGGGHPMSDQYPIIAQRILAEIL